MFFGFWLINKIVNVSVIRVNHSLKENILCEVKQKKANDQTIPMFIYLFIYFVYYKSSLMACEMSVGWPSGAENADVKIKTEKP